jgi:uncharacterized protein
LHPLESRATVTNGNFQGDPLDSSEERDVGSSRTDQGNNDADIVNELEEFRAAKDDFFLHHPQSPLTPGQRAAFTGLAYFHADPALRIEGLLDTDVDRDEAIKLQTTGGGTQEYRRAGRVRFWVDGEQAEITLYHSDPQHDLFVPFRDATSGRETYGAGRYLEVGRPGPDGRVVVDFNYAYNPYCAYNADWSCPLPPGENWLRVPLRAGERNFTGEAA